MIDSLPSENSRRAYQRHLEEFFVWHGEQNRPELNKALINRYVKELRARKLSSATINQKLSAIRKFASESEDNNLLDSKIANGIRAVKGVPFRGRRTGNWLTREDAQKWLNAPALGGEITYTSEEFHLRFATTTYRKLRLIFKN